MQLIPSASVMFSSVPAAAAAPAAALFDAGVVTVPPAVGLPTAGKTETTAAPEGAAAGLAALGLSVVLQRNRQSYCTTST